MCRNYRVQQDVIRAAKQRADEVYAVYENDGIRNLTTIIEIKGHEGTSYDVHRYGDVEVRRRVPHLFDTTFKALARSFDVDRRTCQMVLC